MNKWFARLMIVGLSLASANVARAQYYPNPYYNPYGSGGFYGNAGGQLIGSAAVMQSYGDVIKDQETARIQREQANQAKLDTKKKAFDLMMYEKANTPTYTEELTADQAQILTRVMNFPVKSEINDGKSLNIMLPYLQSLSTAGTQGPPVPISQSIVNQLNISGSGTSSVGMLRDGGQVEWPIALMGDHQKKLDKLLPQAYSAAATGKLTPKIMKEVRTELKAMRQTMRDQLQKDEIETSSYLQGIEFYNSLESSVNALEKPDARKQLAGAYSPRARNVQELVDFMSDNGVKFAPATPGNENAYKVVHDAFVRYARAAQGSAGFTAMNAPVRTPGKKK
ncbi:MAG TPA: hypothetical protein VFE62_28530 [Gemmataceae bacterium]|nr:hypothetical protein [Gemmataceae bacterium]